MNRSDTQNSRDEVLKRMLKTPPTKHAGEKHPRVAKPKPSRARPAKKTV